MDEENHFDKWANEHCKLVDELAKQTVNRNSPEYQFQQESIRICRQYRMSKALDTHGMTFRIEHTAQGESIRCLACDRVSFHQDDILYKFCGNCDVYHPDPSFKKPKARYRFPEEEI